MAVDSRVDINLENYLPRIELSANARKALILLASTMAVTMAVGSYLFFGVMPEISSQARAQAVLSSLEESPVGSVEFMSQYEALPKNRRESAVQMSWFDGTRGKAGEWVGSCSAQIVDQQKVTWVNPDGKHGYGTMYTGVTADHCFGGFSTTDTKIDRYTPSQVMVFSENNVLNGDQHGDMGIFLSNEPISDMHDGSIFSFLVEGEDLNIATLGIDALEGGDDLGGPISGVSFPAAVMEHTPRVFEFSSNPDDLDVLNRNSRLTLEGSTVKGESGANIFDQEGRDRGIIIEELTYHSDKFNVSLFPENIQEQVKSFVERKSKEFNFEKYYIKGLK